VLEDANTISEERGIRSRQKAGNTSPYFSTGGEVGGVYGGSQEPVTGVRTARGVSSTLLDLNHGNMGKKKEESWGTLDFW